MDNLGEEVWRTPERFIAALMSLCCTQNYCDEETSVFSVCASNYEHIILVDFNPAEEMLNIIRT